MVKVKICGITNLKDALKIAKLDPEALGFIFYKKSPRYIDIKEVKKIIQNIPPSIKRIGVFVNEKEHNIKLLAKYLSLDILQFHGNESEEFCKRFKNYKVIKSIRVKDKDSLKDIGDYPVWGLLFDSFKKNLFGGTAKTFNWKLIKDINTGKKQIFLSGGLNTRNVITAIKLIRPDWVDVSSSVEVRAGRKDIKKVKKFIEAVRNVKR